MTDSILKISKNGKCLSEGCINRIKKDSKAYCENCKRKREEFFKNKHYERMGWNVNKKDENNDG